MELEIIQNNSNTATNKYEKNNNLITIDNKKFVRYFCQ